MDNQDRLPLTESTYFILLSLAHGPLHGYAILKAVKEISDGRIALSTGTLYGAIKRLLDLGWIERVNDKEDGNAIQLAGRPRKSYSLTSLGSKYLDGEITRIHQLLAAANFHMEGKKL
jgi:DNA-binding PadR family transcriptional regulator